MRGKFSFSYVLKIPSCSFQTGKKVPKEIKKKEEGLIIHNVPLKHEFSRELAQPCKPLREKCVCVQRTFYR